MAPPKGLMPPGQGGRNPRSASRAWRPGEARTAYSGQVAASPASSEAALRALEESTERIIQGLRDFMERVRAGNGENYNRSPS